MQTNEHNLVFSKLFDTKSPRGINQTKESGNMYTSAGVDVYMPRLSSEFIDAISKSNEGSRVVSLGNSVHIMDGDNKKLMFSRETENGKTQYIILGKIQIPLGIAVIIPEGYHLDLRSKSSNFKSGYTSVTGLIDDNYTFGMGVQIIPLVANAIIIDADQKIAQLTMIKTEKIMCMNEMEYSQFEQLREVSDRRNVRVGGFGSTGKF